MARHSWIYGLHGVAAVVRYHPERVIELWLDAERRDARMRALLDQVAAAGLRVQRVARKELDRLAEGAVHQGALARVHSARAGKEGDLERLLDGLEAPPLLLVLDGVTDPHNLGACLRTADAAGVHAVITPRDRSAGLGPVVDKVSSGASQVLPFFQVVNLARTLKSLKQQGIWLTGLTGEAPRRLYDQDLGGPLALVLGAEGQGLRRLTREACDHLVHIPMLGHVESLNVSVATGVCLFEALRQRGVAAFANHP